MDTTHLQEQLSLVKDEKGLQRFYHLVSELLSGLNLTDDDPRLSLSYRSNGKRGPRICVTVNNRYVTNYRIHDSTIGMLIKRDIIEQNKELFNDWESYEDFIARKKGEVPPLWISKKLKKNESISNKIKDALLLSAADELDYAKSSSNRKYHIPSLYELIINDGNTFLPFIEDEEALSFPEGKEKYYLHRSKERSRELVQKAKESILKIDPMLHCEICEFSFKDKYGELGYGFIEAHHKIPISQLTESTKTKIEDLAMVCSNCHRMLHQGRSTLSIEELTKKIVS